MCVQEASVLYGVLVFEDEFIRRVQLWLLDNIFRKRKTGKGHGAIQS
jgi:hypothetical protein